MIGQLHSVVIDAPDAHALARFYADLLGMDVKGDPGDDWVVVTGAGYRIAFQQAPDLRPPDWPDPERPQQFHLDIRVADVEEAEPKVLALGATAAARRGRRLPRLRRPGRPPLLPGVGRMSELASSWGDMDTAAPRMRPTSASEEDV